MTGINPTSTTTHHNIKKDRFDRSFKPGDLYLTPRYGILCMGIVIKETPQRFAVFEETITEEFINRKYVDKFKDTLIGYNTYFKIAYIGNYRNIIITNDVSSLPEHFTNMSIFLKQRLFDYHQHLKYEKQKTALLK